MFIGSNKLYTVFLIVIFQFKRLFIFKHKNDYTNNSALNQVKHMDIVSTLKEAC